MRQAGAESDGRALLHTETLRPEEQVGMLEECASDHPERQSAKAVITSAELQSATISSSTGYRRPIRLGSMSI
jgi:hypothetical protein